MMKIDSNTIVPMTDANQNFSKVVRIVDENGTAVIMKNNKPRYMVVKFEEYDEVQAIRKKLIKSSSDKIIKKNINTLIKLSKC